MGHSESIPIASYRPIHTHAATHLDLAARTRPQLGLEPAGQLLAGLRSALADHGGFRGLEERQAVGGSVWGAV